MLENRPEAFLIIPTLSLLVGQAFVSFDSMLVAAALLVAAVLLILLAASRLWRWFLLALFSAATFAAGYLMHHFRCRLSHASTVA